jgi:hypothetical protein
VVNELDKYDASSIAIFQEIFKDTNEMKTLKTDLAYIHENFSSRSQYITKLETTTNLLSETIREMNDIQDGTNNVNGSGTDAVKQKLPACSVVRMKGFKLSTSFQVFRVGSKS